jgi:soluble P-type ATPase
VSIDVRVPGFGVLALAHLVLDFNGTLAVDGTLLPGVKRRLDRLARSVRIHVVTADTFGKARANLANVDCRLEILASGAEGRAKAACARAPSGLRASAMGVTID